MSDLDKLTEELNKKIGAYNKNQFQKDQKCKQNEQKAEIKQNCR